MQGIFFLNLKTSLHELVAWIRSDFIFILVFRKPHRRDPELLLTLPLRFFSPFYRAISLLLLANVVAKDSHEFLETNRATVPRFPCQSKCKLLQFTGKVLKVLPPCICIYMCVYAVCVCSFSLLSLASFWKFGSRL